MSDPLLHCSGQCSGKTLHERLLLTVSTWRWWVHSYLKVEWSSLPGRHWVLWSAQLYLQVQRGASCRPKQESPPLHVKPNRMCRMIIKMVSNLRRCLRNEAASSWWTRGSSKECLQCQGNPWVFRFTRRATKTPYCIKRTRKLESKMRHAVRVVQKENAFAATCALRCVWGNCLCHHSRENNVLYLSSQPPILTHSEPPISMHVFCRGVVEWKRWSCKFIELLQTISTQNLKQQFVFLREEKDKNNCWRQIWF